MRQLRDATEDIKQEIQRSADKQGIDTSVVKSFKEDIDKVKDTLKDSIGKDVKTGLGGVSKTIGDITGSIRRK